jgi:hypothetical protein
MRPRRNRRLSLRTVREMPSSMAAGPHVGARLAVPLDDEVEVRRGRTPVADRRPERDT